MAEKLQMKNLIDDVEKIEDASKINLKGTEKNLDNLNKPTTDEERRNKRNDLLMEAKIVNTGRYIELPQEDGKFYTIAYNIENELVIKKDENTGREGMNDYDKEILDIKIRNMIYEKVEYKDNIKNFLKNDSFCKDYGSYISGVEIDNMKYFLGQDEYKGNFFNIKGGKITFRGYNKELNFEEGLRVISLINYIYHTAKSYYHENFKRNKKGNIVTDRSLGNTTLLKNDVIKAYLPSIENDESFAKYLSTFTL